MLGDFKICIHDPKIDQYISKAISRGSYREAGNINVFRGILAQNPDLDVIDIGANIVIRYTGDVALMR